MTKTVLELVDRLTATSNRAVLAEANLERNIELLKEAKDKVSEMNDTIAQLNTEIVRLKREIESKNTTINYWADKACKYEAELKELKKNDTDGT